MKTGFDAVLLDSSGNLIDYFTLGGDSKALNTTSDASCDPFNVANSFFDVDFSSSGTSAKSLHRNADGVGDWGKTTSGADPGTSDGTNDTPPASGTITHHFSY